MIPACVRSRGFSAVPVLALLAACLAAPTGAQLAYKGCADLKAADFQMTELFNRKGTDGAAADADLSEPTRMDVLAVTRPNGQFDHADIIFVERLGKVKWFDGVAKKVTLMGTIAVHGNADNGLMGVAFHPDFAKNRWIYLWYSPKQLIGQNRQLRLTRITVKPDNTLDMASEKILINILASKTDTWHSGGPMQFDAYGDLWVGVGNNSSDLNPDACNVLSPTDSTASSEWGSSNTASLRGGFFRIHPDSGAKGYSIPRGNFGEYWADQFDKQGKAALAAQYRDPKKVLPEVYVKGERSNFSIGLHPTKRWLGWGTVNYAGVNDEFNITAHPSFTGFPYYHADNAKTCGHSVDAAAPRNTSPLNSGVVDLPPAVPGALNNLVNVAIGGPIYDFDPGLASESKFPPHFDDKWIVSGFRGGMWVVTLDSVTLKPINTLKVDNGLFGSFISRNHVMSMYGRDGALYILNYDGYYNSALNPGAMRVAYKGDCRPGVSARDARPEPYQKIWLTAKGIEVGEAGPHAIALFDLGGRRVWSARGNGAKGYGFAAMRAGLRPGIYQARVTSAAGTFTRRVSLD